MIDMLYKDGYVFYATWEGEQGPPHLTEHYQIVPDDNPWGYIVMIESMYDLLCLVEEGRVTLSSEWDVVHQRRYPHCLLTFGDDFTERSTDDQ